MELVIFEKLSLPPKSEIVSDPIDVFYFDEAAIILNYLLDGRARRGLTVDVCKRTNDKFTPFYSVPPMKNEVEIEVDCLKEVKVPKTRLSPYIGLWGTDKIKIRLFNEDDEHEIEVVNLSFII
ncbi:MAG: hypothetical protein EF807_07280 [Candidatus Methanolliviera hydrocarbonicum]|jgi:hypothetical protein|uniref:Uncharacterized protein n=1 Tax=Candidatus Methanolliviera hydrocarbonicum TaxID=2491085 RepID=A0A520KV68_9EURY|nr:MAG: hypothetical protein EF807_07280 [Candidatus Methanolliviera hydrocarbonicum]